MASDNERIIEFCRPIDVYTRVPDKLREKLAEFESGIGEGDKIAREVARKILKSSFFPDQSNSFVKWMASQPKPPS